MLVSCLESPRSSLAHGFGHRFTDMFTSLTGVLFPGIMAGIYSAQLPNLNDARVAASNILALYKSFSEDPDVPSTLLKKDLTGAIEFRNVTFRYPSRPDVKVRSLSTCVLSSL